VRHTNASEYCSQYCDAKNINEKATQMIALQPFFVINAQFRIKLLIFIALIIITIASSSSV
jgi:hypothetical protein